jgi:hypothetical protein
MSGNSKVIADSSKAGIIIRDSPNQSSMSLIPRVRKYEDLEHHGYHFYYSQY